MSEGPLNPLTSISLRYSLGISSETVPQMEPLKGWQGYIRAPRPNAGEAVAILDPYLISGGTARSLENSEIKWGN